jgi:hypothetical protein
MITVQVKFPMCEAIWGIVIIDAEKGEEPVVEHEGIEFFTVEYPSREHFNRAVGRFDSIVQYTEITTK